MLHLYGGVTAALNTLLEELQCEASDVSRQLLTDMFDEERVVARDTQAGRLKELVVNF